MPHGVDYRLFASTLDQQTPRAADIDHVSSPVFMFIGHISYDWLDAELVKFVATSRPDWNIVLVGRYSMDIDEFDGYGNILLAGEKPFERLPEYCKVADVGIIPFVDSELTRNCNPLKLPEYIAAGLPVVSTDIPEVARSYAEFSYIGRDYDSFLQACERALRENDAATNLKRSAEMEQSSWDNRVETIFRLLGKTLEEGGVSPCRN